jgi:hypothetical protein
MVAGRSIRKRFIAILLVVSMVFAGGIVFISSESDNGRHDYYVSFETETVDYTRAEGWAAYGTSVPDSFPLILANVSAVHFAIRWSDDSLSALPDPAVAFEAVGPNASGSSRGDVPNSGVTFDIILSEPPVGGTWEASSPEEAIDRGQKDVNTTVGQGEWNWFLIVSEPDSGEARPRGTISWTLYVTVDIFEGHAESVTAT